MSWCAWLACAACDVTFARGLDGDDARALGERLNRHGVAVNVLRESGEPARYRLEVTDSAVARAVEAVRATPELRTAEAATSAAQPLIATRAAEQQNSESALRNRLRRELELLPFVARAEVAVRLPVRSGGLRKLLTTDSQPSSVHVWIVPRARGPGLDTPQIRALVAAAAPGLSTADVTVTAVAPTETCEPCSELSHIGALTVTRASIATLKLWLGASLLLHMFGALALLVLMRARARAQH